MYKFDKNHQFGLADFNQPMGLKMNPENRWVKKAETIPWEAIEEKYAALFSGKKGMPAKPLRTAPGSLLIQKQLQFSDRELVEEIRENPYFQYFIGLPGYQDAIPFVPSFLVEFRKRRKRSNPCTYKYPEKFDITIIIQLHKLYDFNELYNSCDYHKFFGRL